MNSLALGLSDGVKTFAFGLRLDDTPDAAVTLVKLSLGFSSGLLVESTDVEEPPVPMNQSITPPINDMVA